jgi:septum formation protein
MYQLVLSSSSPYRKAVLNKLGIAFAVETPDIDESIRDGESPEHMVKRLAQEKALAIQDKYPQSLIIGSDQIALLNGHIFGKPGDQKNAIEQLTAESGQQVQFLIGLCLLNSETGNLQVSCENFAVQFRELNQQQIEYYVEKDKPFNCAGSFKSEGLGMALFAKLSGDDPNALLGLPLIKLVSMLDNEGFSVLG